MLPSSAHTISSFISMTNFNIMPHVRLYLLLSYYQFVPNQSLYSDSYFSLHDRRPVHPVGPYAV